MKIHMVKKGESLYLIAQKYNVPLEALIGANPEIANPDVIDVGMKVKIPAPAQPAYEMMHQHTVKQGDTLWKLSKAWGIPLSDMIKANPQLKNPNVLLTGEVVNIPKLPTAGSGGASHAMPGAIHGKKNTAVMPEAVVEEPAAPVPVPEVKEVEMIAPEPVVEMPPMPLPTPMPMPMPMPQIEMKHPYPMTIKQEIHEHNLFAQYPVPAVEASAQAPAEPCPPEAAYYAQQGMGDYGNQGYYAHYHPSDWSGEAAKQGAYGDVSPAAAPSPVQPSASHGYMSMPTNVAPAAGAAHNPYAAGYWPSPMAWPASTAAGAANADDCGCGCGGASYAQPIAGTTQWPYPGMTQATMPAASAGYPSAAHYGHSEMASPAFAQPAGIAPATAMPEFPSGMQGYPMVHPAALPGLYDPCMTYMPYNMPHVDSRYGYGVVQYPYYMPVVPTIPAVPPASQAGGHESFGGDADSLALHGAEEEMETAPAPRSRKQGGSGKSKRVASVKKAKPKRKESLPWIRW